MRKTSKPRMTPATEAEVASYMRRAGIRSLDEPQPGTIELQGWGELIGFLERSGGTAPGSRG